MARIFLSLQQQSVQKLHGVGEKKAAAYAELGIATIFDLLTYFPRRYIDRTTQHSFTDAEVGQTVTVVAEVESVRGMRVGRGRSAMSRVAVRARDESATFDVTFFRQPWREKQLQSGLRAVFSGKVTDYKGKRQLINPLVDIVGDRTDRIIAVYPQSEKANISSWEIGKHVHEALDRAGEIEDALPLALRSRFALQSFTSAIREIHRPSAMHMVQGARHRLAFDELLGLQLILGARKRKIARDKQGIAHIVDGDLTKSFHDALPFPLTTAQENAITDIAHDMAKPFPMHRLLQGDVGSGKTIVAVAACVMAAQGGYQSAFMAPTEVLAEQHANSIRTALLHMKTIDESSLFGVRPLRIALLTSNTRARERKELLGDVARGEIDLLIGTHALLVDDVQFARLGLVIIDEQHRFGVEQRATLREKASEDALPDVLVMTATPIPRTAAMTVYGDLDMSVIDELPPGRTPVATKWARTPGAAKKVWKAVQSEVKKGRQTYVVCPLIDASESAIATSVTAECERLRANELQGMRVALLHGQLSKVEKNAVMQAFRDGETDVLVATTVIEVGVDVPNATVMVIEDAGRFGIAQLHQLRGRVGRGAATSQCWLLESSDADDVATRLNALCATHDGFALAEIDLELRGSGSILGARQKGRTDLLLSALGRDSHALIAEARAAANEILDSDPQLAQHPLLVREINARFAPEDAAYLFKN